ncbi:MAG: cytochrome c biogenesis protein CcmE [Deltaproteobacteria bacterium CG11_big_fil_rev_8_21_14_0_20_47_16]|nr:MAG: cytochrome c biogenesis protein CcmE [Deltaproteobacteria bacterium CG11_big_fil_rev_8_21_14_0_20_47_16]
MNRYIVGTILIVAGLVYMGVTVFRSSMQYYVTVSEFRSNESKYDGKTLKVAGKVKEGSVQKTVDAGMPVYTFTVVDAGQELQVVYRGLVPDTFKAGSDVVATGHMQGDHFEANHILAKCASKYEAKVQS